VAIVLHCIAVCLSIQCMIVTSVCFNVMLVLDAENKIK